MLTFIVGVLVGATVTLIVCAFCNIASSESADSHHIRSGGNDSATHD